MRGLVVASAIAATIGSAPAVAQPGATAPAPRDRGPNPPREARSGPKEVPHVMRPPAPVPAPAPAPSAHPEGLTVAYGASLGWQLRRDFGSGTRPAFAPELWTALYLKTGAPRWFLRPAFRVGYVGLDQAEMPGAIAIEERDLTGALELGVVRDGVVIPTAAIGGGPIVRFVDLDAADPIETDGDPVSGTEVLGRLYLQLGLGVPMFGGALVVEPSARLQQVFGDDRIRWRLAADLSLSF